jgi:hypothetical protein
MSLLHAVTAGIALFSPCIPQGGGACYVNETFAVGCAASGGSVIDVSNVPNCALRAPATQFMQCGGVSCYTTGAQNFTEGCAALRGFVSGADTSMGAPAYCIAPTAVVQFTSCPASAKVCVGISNDDFYEGCARVGGFVDAFLGPKYGSVPQCSAPATVFTACPSDIPGGTCVLSSTFASDCAGKGGFVPGTADGLPLCALPGAWSSWVAPAGADLGAFAKTCQQLDGILSAQGVCLVKEPSA